MASSTTGEGSGEACWICLCEEPDDSGPLRRDCSCRGHAGFVHLSCLISYAEDKSNALAESIPDDRINAKLLEPWVQPWRVCPNCGQDYQHQLALDMVNCFVEKDYPRQNFADYMKRLEALRLKSEVLKAMDFGEGYFDSNTIAELSEEGKNTANKTLLLCEQTKDILGIPRSATIGDRKYARLSLLFPYGVAAHSCLGQLAFRTEAQEGYKVALEHYMINQAAFKAVGYDDGGNNETIIKFIKGFIVGDEGTRTRSLDDGIEQSKQDYEESVQLHGADSGETLASGTCLATCLGYCYRGIEAERLLRKLVPISQRVLGPKHDDTKHTEAMLGVSCKRIVRLPESDIEKHMSLGETRSELLDENDHAVFQALGYVHDGDNYFVRGPVSVEGLDMIGVRTKMFRIGSKSVVFGRGTPVLCHGLKNAKHLNGKLGGIQSYDFETSRYAVYFPDDPLKPVKVKAANLNIVFDLPDSE